MSRVCGWLLVVSFFVLVTLSISHHTERSIVGHAIADITKFVLYVSIGCPVRNYM